MIQKLQKRLTFLCGLLTSLILLVTLAAAWHFSAEQYEANQKALFGTSFHFISDHIASGSVLRDSWLKQQETTNQCIIYIEDGTIPLYYSGDGVLTDLRECLINAAKDRTTATDSSALPFSYFLYGGSKNSYFGMYSVISPPDSTIAYENIHLWVLFDYSAAISHIRLLALRYFLLWLLGSIALFAISYLLVRLAIKPTAIAITQQNEFIAAASHELRSPLTVMKANLCALQESFNRSDIKDKSEYVDKEALLSVARKETDRMQHLTDDLLLLAGSDANAWNLTMQPVQLETLLIEVYETFYNLAGKQQHPFTLLLPEQELPAITADEDRLKQLLGILLNNAFSYSPAESPVALSGDLTNHSVILSVIDHGNGIPDTEKKAIFRRFYRCDESRTDKSHFGLGLSVAKEIAHAHNASIKISDTPGGGATFSICFLFHE